MRTARVASDGCAESYRLYSSIRRLPEPTPLSPPRRGTSEIAIRTSLMNSSRGNEAQTSGSSTSETLRGLSLVTSAATKSGWCLKHSLGFKSPLGRGAGVGWFANCFATAFLALLLFGTETRAADAAGAPTGVSLESFKLVSERNIFDPNRTSRANRIMTKAPEVPPKIESFSLIGALLWEEGTNAFFAGTESPYNTVLSPGESIAGHKFVQLEPDSVRLETNGNPINLSIGMQMKRVGEGSWQLVVGTANPSSAIQTRDRGSDSGERRNGRSSSDERRDRRSFSDNRSSARPSPAPIGDSGTGESAEDILKRLMEKRRQEANQ